MKYSSPVMTIMISGYQARVFFGDDGLRAPVYRLHCISRKSGLFGEIISKPALSDNRFICFQFESFHDEVQVVVVTQLDDSRTPTTVAAAVP